MTDEALTTLPSHRRGHVRKLTIAPVKGMRAVHPQVISVGESGVAADRRFLLYDPQTRKQKTALDAALTLVSADWDADENRLRFTLPGGHEFAEDVHLGGNVEILRSWGLEPLRCRRVEGQLNERLSSALEEAVELAWAPSIGGNDVAPLTLLADASIKRLADEMGVDELDTDRFRMTIIAEGLEEHEEDSWYGRELVIGSATIRVLGPVPRCAVTTRDPLTAERDYPVVKALVAYREPIYSRLFDELAKAPLGVYAEPVVPGLIATGDAISLVEQPPEEASRGMVS
jgi:hypothetical protein